MSLVSTWVQADDGRFYRNPVLVGDGWFLCFDDEDPPELVVEHREGEDSRARAEEILAGARIPARITRAGSRSRRVFSETIQEDDWRLAEAWWVDLEGPIPHEFVRSPESAAELNIAQGVIYRFDGRRGRG